MAENASLLQQLRVQKDDAFVETCSQQDKQDHQSRGQTDFFMVQALNTRREEGITYVEWDRLFSGHLKSWTCKKSAMVTSVLTSVWSSSKCSVQLTLWSNAMTGKDWTRTHPVPLITGRIICIHILEVAPIRRHLMTSICKICTAKQYGPSSGTICGRNILQNSTGKGCKMAWRRLVE